MFLENMCATHHAHSPLPAAGLRVTGSLGMGPGLGAEALFTQPSNSKADAVPTFASSQDFAEALNNKTLQ